MPRPKVVAMFFEECVLFFLIQLMERSFWSRPLNPLVQIHLNVWRVGEMRLHRLHKDSLVGGLFGHGHGQVGIHLQRSNYRKLLVEKLLAHWQQIQVAWPMIVDIK